METVLGIFCKHPIPGQVKTRLAKDIGDEAAARLYEAFLTDLVDRMRTVGDERILCYAPAEGDSQAYFAVLAGSDYGVMPQVDGDVGDRLAAFFDMVLDDCPRKVIVVGSDSPTISTAIVNRAADELDRRDAVLGSTDDGGYYLIGLRRTARHLFDGIDWSTSAVYDQQHQRLDDVGFTTTPFVPVPEVDTLDDLNRLLVHPLLDGCRHTLRVLDELHLT